MVSPEQNPEAARTQQQKGPDHFGIAATTGPQGNETRHWELGLEPTMSSQQDSLGIGPKGESSFPCLSSFLSGYYPPNFFQESQSSTMSSPSISSQMNAEGEYPVSKDFRKDIPQISLLPADIQGDQAASYAPPVSPDLSASLQMLTLEGSTRNREKFKTVNEMYVCFSELGEHG
jgi:hypothetical protein